MAETVLSQVPTRRGGVRWTVAEPPLKIVEFVQWLTEQREDGQTYRDYARMAGFSEVTVQKWLRDSRVQQLIEAALTGTIAGPIPYMEVLHKLHDLCIQNGDVKAGIAYLQAVGRMAPRRTEVDVRITDTRNLSNDELRAELHRAVILLENQAELTAGIEDAEVIEDDLDLDVGALDT